MNPPNPGVLKVAFNDPDEFLHDVRQDRNMIERKVLRVTVRRRYALPFVHLSVLASIIIDGSVVLLEHRLGECFLDDEKSSEVAARMKSVLAKLDAAAADLGLEVRPGVFE